MAKIAITDKYSCLYRVPKNAIVDFLINEKKEVSVRKAIQAIDDLATGKLISLLIGFDLKQLIYIFQKCTETTSLEANDLYRRYRYRGMKTLYIYSREGKCNLQSFNMSALNMIISNKVSELKVSSKKFKNLEIKKNEGIDGGHIQELSYTYHGFIPYIPPETGYPDTVTDLRRGFIWIPSQDPWICICGKDASVVQVLHDSLKQYFQINSKALSLTKTVQKALENMEDMRKAAYLSTGGTARRLTNPHMSDDPEAMEECRQRDDLDDRPLAGFNIELDGKSFSLSYNETGYIYFSIDLDVDQMRFFGISKIREIVECIKDLQLNDPGSLFGVKLQALVGVPTKARPAIVDIASAIARCKVESLSDVPLNSDVFEFAGILAKYAKTRIKIFCRQCSDYSEIVCKCGDIDEFSVADGKITCKRCGTLCSDVLCFDGHKNHILKMEDCIEILPLSKLNDLIVKIFKEDSDLNFIASQESFSIKNGRLFYRKGTSKTVYRISDIPKYKQKLLAVPEQEVPVIKKAIKKFKEKCDNSNTDNCAQCIQNDVGTRCYLRLFGLFDSDYTPRPHHGHEFGDFSTFVNIENQQKTMVIAMKSNPKQKGLKEIKLRDKAGQDIYTQVGGYLHDGKIEVVGISVPKKLEESFAAMLKKDAQDKNKKLVVIDDDDLVQIAYSAMQKRNLLIEEI